ncbi:hypothetical protein AN964_01975 [Heyndrickxia shackletonii]|uniref:Uncharacterized protein n=1 Tax=Heyndrickxia shackletonii TaxID=157838 RepID=A0A0Q3WU27_9BACI|nr:hypothetical protein [Heyndrickxia shackletonii]KQL52428.1 hypothetical protein AN964_01975 [Heyndrickxia shackletonii]NEY99008.1 hypothetical protein [Heyndrickxia shackletonii]
MLLLIGVAAGIVISVIGSLFIGMIPYLWFPDLFKLSIVQSILVYLFITFKVKPIIPGSKLWIYSFFSSLFIILIGFLINDRNIFIDPSSYNIDDIIKWVIIYSIGGAIIASPLSYVIIKSISHLKQKLLIKP